MSWFFWFKVHAAPVTLTWSTTEKDIEKQSEVIVSIDTEENIPLDSEEKLSFDTEEVSEENLELNSAEDIDDADKTIKELEEEKDQLITEKIIVTDNFNAFILNNWDLRKFFKLELTSGELSVIEAAKAKDYEVLLLDSPIVLSTLLNILERALSLLRFGISSTILSTFLYVSLLINNNTYNIIIIRIKIIILIINIYI